MIVDPAQLKRFVGSPQGPVLRDLSRRATRVQAGATRQVGKRTQALARSIVKRPGVDSRGPFVVVGAYRKYALIHHNGTRPHIIRASNRKTLRFQQNGVVVFRVMVHHPGTQPNRYLTDNIALAKN